MKRSRTTSLRIGFWCAVAGVSVALGGSGVLASVQDGQTVPAFSGMGIVEVQLVPDLPSDWTIHPADDASSDGVMTLAFDGTFLLSGIGADARLVGGEIITVGPALRLTSDHGDIIPLPDLIVTFTDDGEGYVAVGSADGRRAFDIVGTMVNIQRDGTMTVEGILLLDGNLAHGLGMEDYAGTMIGVVTLTGTDLEGGRAQLATTPDDPFPPSNESVGADGFDVIVLRSDSIDKYDTVGGITGYAIGTTSCNIGNQPGDWYDCNNPNNPICADHPVIAQNMYRLKDGQFEQIGMSWLKHGFCAVNESGCGSCQSTPCDTLGVGCADTYWAGLNGQQSNLGPRSEVNPWTGEFPYPFILGWNQSGNGPYKRIQVKVDDLNPALNGGAVYFAEGHYITSGDEPTANRFNNASYRRFTVGSFSSGGYNLGYAAPTVQQEAGIYAWGANDAGVVYLDADVPNDGRFVTAYKVSDIGGGWWHYEIAIFNMNSDRSARSLTVPIPDDAQVANIEFHDVDHHSGEPYNNVDWTAQLAGGELTWSTGTYSPPPNDTANALRWSTMYNFRFDSTAPPARGTLYLGLYKPGTPDSLELGMESAPAPDCNGNNVADSTDIDEGTSQDANGNDVPDECETAVPFLLPAGARYLSLEVVGISESVALYLTGDSGGSVDVSCVAAYIQPDGTLGPDPVFQAVADWPNPMYIYDAAIVPGTAYLVQADTGQPGDPILGPPESVTTRPWGDINLDGFADFRDIRLVVEGFQGNYDNATLQEVDLEPCTPDGAIDFGDIALEVQAFQGAGYFVASGCAVPCP